jgi:plastocyanin
MTDSVLYGCSVRAGWRLFVRRAVVFSSVLLFALPLSAVVAEEFTITQDDLKFDPPIKVVKPGDTVTFRNDDGVVHNIISLTDEFEFDLGEVKPGMAKSVQFNSKGVVDVECTVHPNMKMTIFVF